MVDFSKATKRPWDFRRHGSESEYFGNIFANLGKDKHGIQEIRTITVQLAYGSFEEYEANAALIVHAVNNIERLEAEKAELVGALEGFVNNDECSLLKHGNCRTRSCLVDENGKLPDAPFEPNPSCQISRARATLAKVQEAGE